MKSVIRGNQRIGANWKTRSGVGIDNPAVLFGEQDPRVKFERICNAAHGGFKRAMTGHRQGYS